MRHDGAGRAFDRLTFTLGSYLRAIGVGASVRHGELPGLRVLELEVLIRELLAVDRLSASTVATREVAALEHEALNHAVEFRACSVIVFACHGGSDPAWAFILLLCLFAQGQREAWAKRKVGARTPA